MSIAFDPSSVLPALLGGALIGAAAAALVLINGRVAGISGILGGVLDAAEDDFRDKAAANISQQKKKKPCHGPAQSNATTPSIALAPDQQCRENPPGGEGEECLVVQCQRFSENGFGKQDATAEGNGQ